MLRRNFCALFLLLSELSGIWTAVTRNGTLLQSRVHQGVDAGIEAAEFMVSIRLREDENKKFGTGHECGGTLISNNVVLTAAHCLLFDEELIYFGDESDWVVVMGNLNRFESKNTLQFNIKSYANGDLNQELDEDIALLFLDGTVPDDHFQYPITLNDGPVPDGTICKVYGWGRDENNEYPATLKTVDLPIIDNCAEKSIYGTSIHEGMFCAGSLEGGPSTCKSDSGGPLVCNDLQVGIASWGKGCGEPKKPSVFQSVAFYKDWILKEVKKHNGTPPKFDYL